MNKNKETIRKMYQEGEPQSGLSNMFGVSRQRIGQIINGNKNRYISRGVVQHTPVSHYIAKINKNMDEIKQRDTRRKLIEARKDSGWTYERIGKELGLSRQRVHQIRFGIKPFYRKPNNLDIIEY